MKRICITGAGGMIGTALTEYALSQNTAVLALTRPGGRPMRIAHPMLTVAECDLGDLETFASDLACDGFVHLAWASTYGDARNDVRTQLRNIEYTLSAVRLAKRLGCRAIVTAGSQAEYGLCSEPLRPDTPAFPRTGYGIAKLAAGQLARLLCAQNGMRHCHARILSVYGGADRAETIVSTCVDSMLRGEAPALTECTQTWDFLHVRDAARALYLLLEKGRDGAVYPVGSGQARALREYVLQIQKLTGCAAEPRFGARSLAQDAVRYLCADISTLTADTGFVPEITFTQGILQTIEERKGESV